MGRGPRHCARHVGRHSTVRQIASRRPASPLSRRTLSLVRFARDESADEVRHGERVRSERLESRSSSSGMTVRDSADARVSAATTRRRSVAKRGREEE